MSAGPVKLPIVQFGPESHALQVCAWICAVTEMFWISVE